MRCSQVVHRPVVRGPWPAASDYDPREEFRAPCQFGLKIDRHLPILAECCAELSHGEWTLEDPVDCSESIDQELPQFLATS